MFCAFDFINLFTTKKKEKEVNLQVNILYVD